MRKHQFEKNTLKFLLVFGLISIIKIIKKPPMKDWLIIFLFKGYISSIMDNLLIHRGYIKYPIKLFKSFDISFIYDYLLFPLSCVYYNQLTKSSSIPMIVLKVFYFSIPMAIVEHWLEVNTKLVKFKKGWNSLSSFASITITFLIVRTFIAFVRKADDTPVPKVE
ncbi:CBO0543 family protein [Bacillus sp. AFS040349]|uniref:CBO0543 family protein n=1 Tax=Bacillus sp. AFS040349 TaxID=2033502 RepID=UPI00159BE9C1|nr:CBO0543 family protein [Bacillus sp. AFS040349]